MNKKKLKHWTFMAICCALGIASKKLISPISNMITEAIHIPGGVSTAFSLMFLVIASEAVPDFGTGTIMGIVQSFIAICFGTVGSMGWLAPIGYIIPGFMIDLTYLVLNKKHYRYPLRMVSAVSISSVCSSLVANTIVFHTRKIPFLIYLFVSFLSGIFFGTISSVIWKKLKVVVTGRKT